MAQADYFLKIDGIPGESTDSKHKDEIELVSFSWGLSNVHGHAGGAVGASSRRADFQDFHFTRPFDKASPQLFLACASGKHIKEANLSVRRAGKSQVEYLKIKFSDVLITTVQDGAGGGDAPQESVGLAFGRIDLEYHPQKASGAAAAALKAGWDLGKNIKV
jgi:type VI secretion system secreted protein Hcp